MSDFANRVTRGLTPYIPGEQPKDPGLVKLNTNESPYPPGPKVREALASFDPTSLRLYPDPESVELRTALAEASELQLDQVFVGNGSDEVLAFIFQTFLEKEGEPLLLSAKTYSFYDTYADRYGIPVERIPLTPDEQIRVADYKCPSQAVILANPNAPTGNFLTPEDIVELCEQNLKRLVVIDEAYIDFAPKGISAVPLIGHYPNLLVVQTFSKSRSLAGLRVGMAYAQAELIQDLVTQKNTFNSYPLDRLAQALAKAALTESGYYRHQAAKIIETRQKIAKDLKDLGFEVTPSAANFLWVRHPRVSGAMIFEKLRSARVLVRRWKREDLAEHLRVTIGTQEQMDVLLYALKAIIET